jgi:hypothetical protein
VVSCSVQAVAGIIEAAQSFDGFLASFLLGATYALQLEPDVRFVSWHPDRCIAEELQGEDIEAEQNGDCVPFHDAGGMVLTLGFVLVAALFLPLGRGNLEDTILVQIISFAFLCFLLALFQLEFATHGMSHTGERCQHCTSMLRVLLKSLLLLVFVASL